MTKRLIFCLQLIFLTFTAFSQEIISLTEKEPVLTPFDLRPRNEINFYPTPAMDLKTEVTQIGWINPDHFFSVTNEASWIMQISKNRMEEIETDEGYISHIEVASKSNNEDLNNPDIFTLTNTGVVSIRRLPLSEKYATKQLYPGSPITCAAISPDGAFLATGHTNGEINLSMQLVNTKSFYTTDFKVVSKGICTMKFSPSSNLLACISKEGILDIWDIPNSELLTSMNTIKKSTYPIYFSPNSKRIISAESSTLILERDFNGETYSSLTLNKILKQYQISDDGKYLFELAEDNNIYVYNRISQELLGYIPFFTKSEILSFSFTSDYKKLLVAHKNGMIFIMNVEDVFLDPSAEQPRIESGIYLGGGDSGSGGGAGEISSDIGEHNIDLRINFSVPSDPYILTFTPQIGYLYSPVFKPIYFGGMFEFSGCLPSPSFPYSYIDLQTGHSIHTPYILGPKISAVLGFYKKPWNLDLGWFIEARPSFGLYTFYFPEYGFLDRYFSFAVELQTGFNWKQLLISFGGVYDYRLGPSFSGEIGWRIRMGGG